jgi:hypothetical protein
MNTFYPELLLFQSVPKIKEFKIDEFVSFFNNSTPKMSHLVKGDWVGFYRLTS